MTAPFLVDAAMITIFQACKRKYLLSRKWRPLRWIPKTLFDSCLRQAILDLGNGQPANDVIISATTRLMTTGAQAGLDVAGKDPYKIALDLAACLETIITTLGRRPLLKLSPIPSKPIGDDVEWNYLAHADERGHLHRVITVDRLDDDRISQEMHSWYVFGDICMAKKPMHLHFIEIGQLRDGRRHTPWCRGYQHEYIANRLKFQRKGNKELQGAAWKAVFLADSNGYNAESWVDQMESEGVAETLIHDIEILVPATDHRKAFIRDIKIETAQMQQWEAVIHDPQQVPMSRAACDVPFPCQFQACCYSPTIDVDVRSLGLYKPR